MVLTAAVGLITGWLLWTRAAVKSNYPAVTPARDCRALMPDSAAAAACVNSEIQSSFQALKQIDEVDKVRRLLGWLAAFTIAAFLLALWTWFGRRAAPNLAP